MSKKCMPLWRKAHFQVKMYKTPQCRTSFGSYDVEKVHAVVARSTFPGQHVKNTIGVRTTFGGSDVVSRGRRKRLCSLSKVSKTWRFCSISKNDGRHGTSEDATTTATSTSTSTSILLLLLLLLLLLVDSLCHP